MTAAPLRYLPDVFDAHVEALGMLWRQRRAAVHDPERLFKSLCALDARIDAHIAGTLAIGDDMPPRLRPDLDHPDAARVFSSSLALLHGRDSKGAKHLLAQLAEAKDDVLHAMTDALAMSATPRLLEHLLPLTTAGDAPRRLAILGVFAMRGAALPHADTLETFAADADAPVRIAAWRLLAHRGTSISDSVMQRGLADDELAVRQAAVVTAMWTRTPWLLDAARQALRKPSAAQLPLLGTLAMLGTGEDHTALTYIVADAAFGPGRFDIARQVGTADMVERCIAAMIPDDPGGAAAAGLAFWRITGESCAGPTRVSLAPPDASDFDKAFADEVVLPDPVEARRRWTRISRSLGAHDRLMHGTVIGAPVDTATLGRFDMIARRELYACARWANLWQGSPLSLESFPQR